MATTKKVDYSALIGLWKTAKNSAYLLIPFLIAVMVGVPAEYGWVSGPIIYFLKNRYEVKSGLKLG